MAWTSKKYERINWKNRPSTATALGATNLNKIDVFCNEVDNYLITLDAGKLDIATANNMLASVEYNKSTGIWTFKELDGTVYTFDQNIEKIPVKFSLASDGTLTMTTEDGTEFEVNIADLIKSYEFDDSETVGFTKSYSSTDEDGKGAYHVTAIVKAGSINSSHLNPDYRAEIQEYTAAAQTAASDALTYSKDAKRWSEGDSAYDGSETDNAKYYYEQAKASAAAASESEEAAEISADTATEQAKIATQKATSATVSANSAAADALTSTEKAASAAASASAAAESEKASAASEEAAESSENLADQYQQLSKRYAIGGVVPEDAEDNSEWYYQQTKELANAVASTANLFVPHFYIDFDTGCLMSETEAKGITFWLENGCLYGEVA